MKKIIITGGATRIGAAIAKKLSGQKKEILIHYNKSKLKAEALKKELEKNGTKIYLVKGDLSKETDVNKIVKFAKSKLKYFDCLINNASLFENDKLENFTTDSWGHHLRTNLRTPALLSKEFAKNIKGKNNNIINIIDQRVFKLTPYFFSYTISKTGQKNLLVKSSKNGIELIKTRKNTIPSDQNAVINVKFNKFSKENYISAVDVANNDFDQKKVENKIILIGSSAQALFDIVKIANGKYVPGVEIHAHIIDNIFKNESIIKNIYTQLAENIIFLLLLIFLIFIPMKIKPKFSIIFFVGSIFVINLSSIIIYQFNFYLDFLFSSVAGTLLFMTSLYFRYLEENSIAIENDKKQSILKKEREIAGEVQKKLFPNNKKIEKYIFAKNTPAKDVSGDYYDYYQVSDNEIYFILGDVTGKGVKAGILMANAAAVFRSLAKMESSVAKTALYMNNQVKDSSYQAMFITVILGKINLEKKEMEFINMGHEPMMVLDPNFNFEYVKSTLPPMGLMPVKDESFFKTTTMDISDKTILIYTDGVTEGYVDEGKELEVVGLENEIKKLNTTSPETIITHATKILTEKGYTLRDDITALGIKIIN